MAPGVCVYGTTIESDSRKQREWVGGGGGCCRRQEAGGETGGGLIDARDGKGSTEAIGDRWVWSRLGWMVREQGRRKMLSKKASKVYERRRKKQPRRDESEAQAAQPQACVQRS